MKINEALEAIKLYRGRISELGVLRSDNSHKEVHDYDMFHERGGDKGKIVINEPMYDVKKIDRLMSKLSKELRLLDAAIKQTNASVDVIGYASAKFADIELGELEEFEIEKKDK